MHKGSSMIYEIYVGLHLYQFELLLLSLSKLILTLEIQQDWKSILNPTRMKSTMK